MKCFVSCYYDRYFQEPERQNDFPVGQSDSDEKSVPGNTRNRSKSLDKMFQGYNSAASVNTNKVQETVRDDVQKKSKQKDQDGNFLSRLFGSKRLRLRTSVSKKDLTTEKRSSAVTSPGRLPSPSSPDSPEGHSFFPNPDVNPEQFSPTRGKQNYKQKPPPPPPPDSQPPLPLAEPSQSPPPVPSRHPHYNPAGFEMSTSPEMGVPVLPPLPSNKSDIILKKSPATATSGQFPSSHSQHNFHNSVKNWSYATEGRIRSMVSLSPGAQGVTESRESLATISSLMMDTDLEPDLLDQTEFRNTGKQEKEEKPESGGETVLPYGAESASDSEEHSENENIEGEYAESRSENVVLFRRKSLNKTIDQLADNDLITEVNSAGQESQSQGQIDQKSDVIDVDEENCDDDNQRDFNPSISPNTESPADTGPAVGGGAPTDPAIREENTDGESGIFSDERKSYEDKKPEPLMDTSNQKDKICQPTSPDDETLGDKLESSTTLPPSFNNTEEKSQEELLSKREPSKRENPVITTNSIERVGFEPKVIKKPEISPKPVPAPRTFFLRPKPDFSKQLNPVNELTNIHLSRRSIIADEDSENVMENKSPQQNDGELSVKERAKSFSDLPPAYNFGPKPFRPSLSPGEVGKTKPKIANKPIPAPRQFRNDPGPETVSLLKKDDENRKSSDDLREKLEDNLSRPMSSGNVDQDEYHLEDIQVKKIADKFQKVVPPKPARKSSPSKKEEDNNAKSSVLNIVTKINSMAVL